MNDSHKDKKKHRDEIDKPKPSILDLVGCMRSDIPFPGFKEEKEAAREVWVREVVQELDVNKE